MDNKHDFILKVENESAISSLNRFVHRRFDRTTSVWTDCAEHNVLMFVMDGEAVCSLADISGETVFHRKVTVLPKGMPFVMEFRSGCEVLTYSFDSYIPMDTSVYSDMLSDTQPDDDKPVAFDIPRVLNAELVNVAHNIGSIRTNETLTYLSMRKVTALMQKSMKPAQTAKLFAIGKSELGGEICRYMKMLENRVRLTKKPVNVEF